MMSRSEFVLKECRSLEKGEKCVKQATAENETTPREDSVVSWHGSQLLFVPPGGTDAGNETIVRVAEVDHVGIDDAVRDFTAGCTRETTSATSELGVTSKCEAAVFTTV